jgi:hypothetical protein
VPIGFVVATKPSSIFSGRELCELTRADVISAEKSDEFSELRVRWRSNLEVKFRANPARLFDA